MTPQVNREALDQALERLNRAIGAACAGGIGLEEVSDDGAVRVQLQGMCRGCSCRGVTVGATLRPIIESVPGVTRLDVPNSGISRFAEARIAAAFEGRPNKCLGVD